MPNKPAVKSPEPTWFRHFASLVENEFNPPCGSDAAAEERSQAALEECRRLLDDVRWFLWQHPLQTSEGDRLRYRVSEALGVSAIPSGSERA